MKKYTNKGKRETLIKDLSFNFHQSGALSNSLHISKMQPTRGFSEEE